MDGTVDGIMTTDVLTLNEEDDLGALAQDIDLTGHRCFPVVDGDRVLGLITHRELLRATLFSPRTGDHRTQPFVATLMRTDYPKVGPSATIREVAALLMGHGIPCVVVVDEGDILRGVVTKDDVLRFVMSEAS